MTIICTEQERLEMENFIAIARGCLCSPERAKAPECKNCHRNRIEWVPNEGDWPTDAKEAIKSLRHIEIYIICQTIEAAAKKNKNVLQAHRELQDDVKTVFRFIDSTRIEQQKTSEPGTCTMEDYGPDLKCSACGTVINSEIYDILGRKRTRYCPLCGRKVKEASE